MAFSDKNLTIEAKFYYTTSSRKEIPESFGILNIEQKIEEKGCIA